MITKDILKEVLAAEIVLDSEEEFEQSGKSTFSKVCGCDMMSDLLSLMNDHEHDNKAVLLLTGLNNPQVVRTCEMVDIKLVVFVRNKQPSDETVQLARECGVTLMCTPYTMYKCCGILYDLRMKDLNGEIKTN
ncbi:MAG TPA: hypothetical protein PLQ76_07550 [bacterium]|nr:hypothetical protein [bacterium]